MKFCEEVPSYEKSAKDFEEIYHAVKADSKYADNVSFQKHQIIDELCISTIKVRPGKEESNLLMITSGLHGMEGYWGGTLLKEYTIRLMQEIDMQRTGIILVHGINPWGMANLRRVNENNVDLNRSFVLDEIPESYNSEYIENGWFFRPWKLSGFNVVNNIRFYCSLVKMILMNGAAALGRMTLLGQYANDEGIYFGGKEKQASTGYMEALFEAVLESDYKKVVHIDLHTGYGPRYQMSIVNSKQEEIKPEQYSRLLDYPLVSSVSNDDFYDIQGDMTEYFYSMFKAANSSKAYYSTCFEFGTVGSSLLNQIASLRIMLQENSLYHMEAAPEKLYNRIKNEFIELYYPSEPEWRRKAEADFERAMRGIIRNFAL